jgi:anti-sigma B factor antagonist
MQMQIHKRNVGDVTVLDLKGRLTLNEGTQQLKDELDGLIGAGVKKIVLNLQDVAYVDSGGLGELVRSLAAVGRHGGQLKLINLTAKITDLLVITKLLTVFDSYDSESAALASFK